MAAMTGLVRSRLTKPANPPRLVCRSAAWPELMALRSAPAENTGPSWVRIPTHASVALLELVDGGFHPSGDVAVDGVASLGAVEREERDVTLQFVIDHGRATLCGCPESEYKQAD